MADTPETKVKKWLRKEMKEKYPGAWHYAPPGGAFGKAGTADDMWLIRAGHFCVTVVIESKSDEGRDPTALQMKCLKDTKANGAVSATMKGKDIPKLLLIYHEVDKRIRLLEEYSDTIGPI